MEVSLDKGGHVWIALHSGSRGIGSGQAVSRVDCHHNVAAIEVHGGTEVWVTRKGAIGAERGDMGIIPGSMGTSTFIVAGKGELSSWRSYAHGAGRRMSRTKARRELTTDLLAEAMSGRTWLADRAGAPLDEHPDSYKDVHQVMVDQQDLVEVLRTLEAVLNYKVRKIVPVSDDFRAPVQSEQLTDSAPAPR